MNDVYIHNLTRKYNPYGGYIAPTKTEKDYQTEIKGLEREIELAKQKIEKLKK